MNTKERLLKFILYKGISMSEFERVCGLGNGYVRKVENSIGKRGFADILRAFPDLNGDWLLYGTGEMLNSTHNTATASGDSSIAAINSQVTMESNALREQVKLLKDIIADKERIITEKERTINLLLETRK